MYTLLYVDDEQSLLEIGKLFLEQGGQFTVDTITSAPDALALLEAKNYDAIVSDYQMPGMDGIEFLKKVRGSGNTIPFILFTGRGREEIVIQALNEGADFYLQKGGDPRSQYAELTHKVQVAVEHHRSGEKIESLNRLYSVLSATNRAMVHLRTKSSFFPEICRILVETGGFRMAWIGLADPEQKVIRPAASAGHVDGYLDHIDIPTEDVPRGLGPTGIAYREGAYFFSNDIALDPRAGPWRKTALNRGYRAMASFPFAPGTKNAGVISVYAPVTGFFNNEIIGLLGELAVDVSFALRTIDDEDDRKAAEEALRDHERREADIIDFLPDATFAIDRSGHVITWNRAIEEMTGVPAAEMLGKGDFEYAIPFYGQRRPILIDLIYEPDEVLARNYSHIRRTKDTLIADTALPHPRGKPLTLMGKAGPLYNRQGEVVGAIESIRDISEMKKAEESLSESEGRFASFMDHLPVTAFIKDENSTNLFVNRRMVESFGEQEWIGKSVYEQFPGEAAEKMIADDQQTLRDGYRKNIENLALKNGERKIFETHKFRIDRGSRPPLIGGFALDITEQKQAEDALRESEEKYRSTIDAFPDAVSVVDPEFRVILANISLLSWLRTLGFSDDIIGKPILEAFPFLPPAVTEQYRTVFSTGTAMVTEETSKIGNTEIRTETRKIPLREHGDIVAIAAIIRDVTEWKHAEDAIRESEERYRNVVEDQTEFISRFLPDGTHVFVNEAYCRYFGLERDETLGHRFRPEIPPGDRERVERFFASLTPDHPVDTIEHRIIMPDGGIRWQRWSDRAIFDPSVRVREYQSVGRDVTERKEEEQVRHENEQRLDSIYNTVGDSIFQLSVEPDGQFRFTSVNAAFCRTTGLPSGQVIGRMVNEIIPEPSLSLVLGKYRQAIAEKAIVRWEETSSYPMGQLTGEVRVSPIFDSTGACTHLIGSVHDITDRKRAEEELLKKNEELNASFGQITASEEELRANVEELTQREQELRESEARLQRAEEVGRSGSWVFRLNENAVSISGGARILYGLDGTRWTIDEVQRIPLPEYRPLLDQAMKELIAGTAPYDIEFRIRRQTDGVVLDIHSLAEYDPVRNVVFGVIHDITGHKQEAEALRQANKKLNLLSSITRHDVANQLTALKGYVQLAGTKKTDPSIADFLRKIGEAADTIDRQIAFTRVYQELGGHAPAWFPLEEIARKAAGSVVPLQFSGTCRSFLILADPMLERVFFNLFENAVRHGKRVTRILVRCEREPDGLLVIVEDDGVGIRPQEKEKIFAKGYGKNTGFGLFLAREILAITGIAIRETGSSGRGARFEMLVPKGAFRLPDGKPPLG